MTSRIAAADPSPIALDIGLGVSEQRWTDIDLIPKGFELDAVLYAQIGVPVYRDLDVLLHGSIAAPKLSSASVLTSDGGSIIEVEKPFRYLPIEVGIGVEYTFPHEIWVSPWVGAEKLAVWDLTGDGFAAAVPSRVVNPTSFAFGVEAGIDLYRNASGSRAGLFVKAAVTPRIAVSHYYVEPRTSSFVQLAAGIAYRFR